MNGKNRRRGFMLVLVALIAILAMLYFATQDQEQATTLLVTASLVGVLAILAFAARGHPGFFLVLLLGFFYLAAALVYHTDGRWTQEIFWPIVVAGFIAILVSLLLGNTSRVMLFLLFILEYVLTQRLWWFYLIIHQIEPFINGAPGV